MLPIPDSISGVTSGSGEPPARLPPIPLTLLSFALGLVIALVVALGRLSSIRVVAWIAGAYISVIRGTPLLVQLFIIF